MPEFRSDSGQGKISGIDVLHFAGAGIRCFAIVTPDPPDEEFQVFTEELPFQSALELACVLKTKIEVSFSEMDGAKLLTRVRLLDR